MTDLTSKYRPVRFSDVRGQSRAVEWLQLQAKTGEARSVLLVGTRGTGKTSSAFVYAKALMCADPADGEPCGSCESCRAFRMDGRNNPDLHVHHCNEKSTIEQVKDLLETARAAPLLGKRRIVVLDEVHVLSGRAREALLHIVERPPQYTTFIFATSEVDQLPVTLRSRLTTFEMRLLDKGEAINFLSAICQAERIPTEAMGLQLVVSVVEGSPRELLRAIEKISINGPISEANVRLALELDFIDRLARYCDALLRADLHAQLQIIDEWPETALRKLSVLHEFFVHQYLSGFLKLAHEAPVMRNTPAALQIRLLDEFSDRAARLPLSADTFWQDAISHLSPPIHVSRAQLAMVLRRFDGLVNGSSERVAQMSPIGSASTSQRMLRTTSGVADFSNGHYLNWADVRPAWDAGMILPQQYGVLFNLRVTIHLKDNAPSASAMTSQLTHALYERLRDWQGKSQPDFHWLYRFEGLAQNGLTVRLVCSVPSEHLAKAMNWLRSKFFARRTLSRCLEYSISARGASASATCRIWFHVNSLRALSRSLDPLISARSEANEMMPLVDLLGVPRRWRTSAQRINNAQQRGASKSLTPASLKKVASGGMRFLSPIDERAWSFIDFDWYLEEYSARAAERARRSGLFEAKRAAFPGKDDLSVARLEQELRALRDTLSADPKSWPRSWRGWWQGPKNPASSEPSASERGKR